MEVGIGTADLERFVPDDRGHAELGTPVELHVGGLAFFVDEAEGVDAEAFHHAEGARDGAVGHDPHEHVGGFGRERGPVPEGVVRGLRLREAAVGLLLGGVDEVGELDGVLDEEHRDVVADEVPVPFGGVHLDGEAAHVAGRVGRAHVAGHGGEADEDRSLDADLGQHLGLGDAGERVGELESSRVRRSRGRGRRARGCARGRSAESSPRG